MSSNEKLQFDLRGEQETTFVCQHLLKTFETGDRIRFYYAGEPRGDAWCEERERKRIELGGEAGDWNDESMVFANIKIICGLCYDELRSNQGQ